MACVIAVNFQQCIPIKIIHLTLQCYIPFWWVLLEEKWKKFKGKEDRCIVRENMDISYFEMRHIKTEE